MKVAELLKQVPAGANLNAYLRAHVKSLYQQHLSYLQLSSERDNPLRDDAIEWLAEIKELAEDFLQGEIWIDPLVDGYLKRLASLNVPKEGAVLRAQARLKKA